MKRVGASTTIPINRHFLRMIVPIVVIVSAGISATVSINDFEVKRESRMVSQKLVFETFLSNVRQPLIQGSLIEAQVRAEELEKNKQIICVELAAGTQVFKGCKEKMLERKGFDKLSSEVFFAGTSGPIAGSVAIIFDNSDLIFGKYQMAGKIAAGLLFLSIVLIGVLVIGLKRIRSELNQLVGLAAEGKSPDSGIQPFHITEFASIAKTIRTDIQASLLESKSKVALSIAKQVAHDIRSPIVSLQMALFAAQDQIEPKLKKVLCHSAQRISDIADDLISSNSRSQNCTAASESVRKLPMSPGLAILELIDEKRFLADNTKSFELSVRELNKERLIEMRVSDFKRIISNLMDNAFESLPDMGSITISCEDFNSMVVISVCDTGSGISQDILRKILSEGGSFGKRNGQGLGLQWVKQTIEAHGGSVTIESTVGIGTTVRLLLPALTVSNVRPVAKFQQRQMEA